MRASLELKKDLSIETLRGVAIILMVAGHVIGGSHLRGLHVPDDSWWRYYYVALIDVRMPLFTLLSGYVYALRPVSRLRDQKMLFKGKCKRLLLPLASVGTCFFMAQMLVPGTNVKPNFDEYWHVFVYGIEHLWFLQAIFLIFLAVGFSDALGFLSNVTHWAVIFALSSCLYVFVTIPPEFDIFSISGAIRLLPFFLLGYGLKRHGQILNAKIVKPLIILGVSLFFSARVITIIESNYGDNSLNRLITIALGTCAVTGLFIAKGKITYAPLAWLGSYSFSIYLLHTFGNVAARLVAQELGIESTGALFVICLLASLLAPIVFERTVGQIPAISWMFLGQRPKYRHRKLSISGA